MVHIFLSKQLLKLPQACKAITNGKGKTSSYNLLIKINTIEYYMSDFSNFSFIKPSFPGHQQVETIV